MSRKIIAFGASSSKASINQKFADFAAHQIPNAAVKLLDLNDFEMPIFSVDRENATGIPDLAKQFKQFILDADGIVISFAEHNGAYSTAFKNIFDWISRIDGNVWGNKPMLLLATSPGPRGGATVLDIALNKFKFMNTNVLVGFSLPSFGQNFAESFGIVEPNLAEKFKAQLGVFMEAL
jgi:NAD(P)H-dependent FMN reductase